ncbi:MAG: endonuclease III domain-containing protein [Calditerrivibrio sp.]|nr:endonuclease III domain-containing protein [Calditerrivibrio sp.]
MEINQEYLIKIYSLLYKRYGDMKWWPAETPFEVAVGAVLTQNTTWKNVEKAISNLKCEDCLNPVCLVGLENDKLKELIKPAGFFNQKSERLKRLAEFVLEVCYGDIRYLLGLTLQEAREQLLNIKGVGFETADSILLYAVGHPIFVIDKYTMRMFKRIGVVLTEKYELFQRMFMENLPKDTELFKNYHAVIVENVKRFCKVKPDCTYCPLETICEKNII